VCDTQGEQKMNRRCPMPVDQANERPVMQWVPVLDASGRTHLEARWTTPSAAAPVPAPMASVPAA
jgi:hypothetical protein